MNRPNDSDDSTLDLDRLATTELETWPFAFARVEDAIRPDAAGELLRHFPAQGFWRIDGHDGEKSYTYAARPLIPIGHDRPVDLPDLDPVWTKFGEELASPAYRDALESATGLDLSSAFMEASIWRWDAGHQLGAHRDMVDKLVTQVFYFSESWQPEWGGSLRILASGDPDDIWVDILPDNGSASLLVRSEHSWHSVPAIQPFAPVPRRSVIVTWYRRGVPSPVWTVRPDGSIVSHVGQLELTKAPAPSARRPSSAVHRPSSAVTDSERVSRPTRIALVGTFDVENFGDLIFPLVARHELEARIPDVELVLYSYHQCDSASWPFSVRSLGDLPADLPTLDAVIVGGGEIVHAEKHIAPGYLPADPGVHHPFGLWLTPSLLAVGAGLPLVWNAPGVRSGIPAALGPLIAASLSQAVHLSVRDAGSAERLDALAPGLQPQIVPDTAFGIRSIVDESAMRAASNLLREAGVDGSYVVLQPSIHLARHEQLVHEVVEAARQRGHSVVEVPIGPVHGDGPGALHLVGTVRLGEWPAPEVLAAIIAGSEAVVVSSLHAGIVAAVFGVPLVRPPAPEAKHGILDDLPSVRLEDAATTFPGRTAPLAAMQDIQERLSEHWDRVAEAVTAGRGKPADHELNLTDILGAVPWLADVAPASEVVSPIPAPYELGAEFLRDPSRKVGSRVHNQPTVSIVIPTLHRVDLLSRCLDSIALHVAGRVPHEVIVVANGTELSDLVAIERRDDIVLVRSRVNRGFGGGCNLGAKYARGQYLVFLNDDVEVTPGWLEYLLATANDDTVGAVGSRVLLADGRVQEVGSVLWRDGTALGVGRGDDPEERRWSAVRDVDFVSACSMLVPRPIWDAIGGFDEAYGLGYYEDVDFAMRIKDAGKRVVVDPRSTLHHAESSSSHVRFRTFLAARSHGLFMERWKDRLDQYESPPTDAAEVPMAVMRAVHRTSGAKSRLLIIDDRLPDGSWGSGFGRMLHVLRELAPSHAIDFLPSQAGESSVAAALAGMGVEVLRTPAEDHLAATSDWYDAIVVSRPFNMDRFAEAIRKYQPKATLMFDVEALWHRRILGQSAHCSDPLRAAELAEDARVMEKMERDAVASADVIICLSQEEADIAAGWNPKGRIHVIPPTDASLPETVARFGQRNGAVFVAGWAAGAESPNVAALEFLATEVIPRVIHDVPDFVLTVTGSQPPPEATRYAGPHIRFVGNVETLLPIYEASAVAVVPPLFGSGVKIKTVEALLHGVPVVATTNGADGVGDPANRPLAVHDDGAGFAAALVGLLTDQQRWESARLDALRYGRQARIAGPSWAAVISQPPVSAAPLQTKGART